MSMANLTETPNFDATVYELATTDPVQGGPGGVDNQPHQSLANRTAWLKQQITALQNAGYSTTAYITNAINQHLQATDPHAQYTTSSEVLALIDGRALKRINMPKGLQRTATNLPIDYPLHTWTDVLENGFYSVYLTVAQNGLPRGWWYIDVQRHSTDISANKNRSMSAWALNTPAGKYNELYHSTLIGSVWFGWDKLPSAADFTSVLGVNMSQQILGGMVIQAGTATAFSSVSGTQTGVILPNSFLNACVAAVATNTGAVSANSTYNTIAKTVSNFTVQRGNNRNFEQGLSFNWIAIGY